MLYIFYYALLRNQTHFKFNRLYLLLAPPLALAFPLVKWHLGLAPDLAVAETLKAIQLPELAVTSNAFSGSTDALVYLTPIVIAKVIYLAVTAFYLFRLMKQVWKVRKLKSQASLIESLSGTVNVYRHRGNLPTFAYLDSIFLGDEEQLTPQEKKQVLAHETAHVQFHHTIDILYYELLTVALWFNPVIWLLKTEIRNVHEYQADEQVMKQYKPKEYSSILSKKILFEMGLPVGSYFQKPQVIKRLHMLQQHGKQSGWLRPLLTLPLLLILLFIFSAQQVTTGIASKIASTPHKTAVAQGTPTIPAPAKATSSERVPVFQNKSTDKTPIANDKAEKRTPAYKKENAYSYVEQMPQFKGGEQEMLKFLGQNIHYPAEAQDKGTEGLIVLSFIVKKDGSISDIQVLKSLGMGTDEEAMRVVELMNGRWLADKQNGNPVPVRYTLPIRFAIKEP
ncbi:TonB family protein [Pontibacter silvestris]|uniref:TonB family protein n=1 Tax=Pontibacter silvestris TaxID=2305183 RepID=A0ABW4X176_9BACT|nr:M56 family metallopeptidase [Pontibacter silvestris]MCC9135523.1 M56 family metallopeptidase [Pontibacter silvestris]